MGRGVRSMSWGVGGFRDGLMCVAEDFPEGGGGYLPDDVCDPSPARFLRQFFSHPSFLETLVWQVYPVISSGRIKSTDTGDRTPGKIGNYHNRQITRKNRREKTGCLEKIFESRCTISTYTDLVEGQSFQEQIHQQKQGLHQEQKPRVTSKSRRKPSIWRGKNWNSKKSRQSCNP